MNRLKELREQKGDTKIDVGNAIGVSSMTVSNWENNKHAIKPDKAQKLADYFEVTVAYLLGYSNFKENGNLKDLLFHEIKALKEYKVLRVDYENYISENDVLDVIARYVN